MAEGSLLPMTQISIMIKAKQSRAKCKAQVTEPEAVHHRHGMTKTQLLF